MDITEIAVSNETDPDRNVHSSEDASPADAIKPTRETYEQLQHAYDRMNAGLFGGALPNALITLQRRNRTYGYFSGGRFARDDGRQADEIALNPAHFRDRPVQEVLSTLAHEMAHLWQHHFGKPGRGRYHNREWAAKMKETGLHPTDTGEEGGKETGDHVHHIIVPDGLFDRLARKMLARGYVITWTEQPRLTPEGEAGGGERGREGKSGKRVKFICPHEHPDERDRVFKAWARHGAALLCGEHRAPMEPAA